VKVDGRIERSTRVVLCFMTSKQAAGFEVRSFCLHSRINQRRKCTLF
jgi:hypothetical protein